MRVQRLRVRRDQIPEHARVRPGCTGRGSVNPGSGVVGEGTPNGAPATFARGDGPRHGDEERVSVRGNLPLKLLAGSSLLVGSSACDGNGGNSGSPEAGSVRADAALDGNDG